MSKTATLYRMVIPDHTCPYGLKARHLLKQRGYAIDEHLLTTRAETDAFKTEHGVKTTPQTFIDGKRIGGYDDLRRFFGLNVADPDAVSYLPVLTVFATALALAVAADWAVDRAFQPMRIAEWAVSFSMVLLAMLKLQDVEKFATMFLNYDLLAKRWVPYGRIYPFAEFTAGTLMAAHALAWLSIPIALVIGIIGTVSVFKAVYIDKRDLKCACVGGATKVPLGFVSLAENLAMIGMAIWMLWRPM